MTQKTKAVRQPLEYYLNLKYPITFYPEKEGGYTAIIRDLPGCMTQGETLSEAMENIEEARELWIETVYETGKKDVPLPSTENEYSGRLLLRIPKSLHRHLSEGADNEGVSLNQYILSLLSEANGKRAAVPKKGTC